MTVPPRPPLARSGLVTHTERARIAVPRDALWPWFIDTPLERALPGGGGMPEVVGTDPLDGPPWGAEGGGRRVRLADGKTVHEAVTEARPPESLRYQVWGFEGLGGLVLDQAQGTFAFAEYGEGTQVTWTYALAPRHAVLRPVVRRVAVGQFRTFMRASLAAMIARAGEDLGTA